ncbi:hypothetical protein [Pseudoneobacillus sp. C159]
MYPYYAYRNVTRNIPTNSNYFVKESPYPNNYPYFYPNYPPTTYPYYVQCRPLPPVDTKLFIKSAKCIQNLMISANTIVNKFATSPKFSLDIMTAAQYSNMKEVERLIHSLGLRDEPKISYTPDGMTIVFDTNENKVNVCHLALHIRWG